MVRIHGYAAAARLLDNTEEMVRERYSHIEAGEQPTVEIEQVKENVAFASVIEDDPRAL